MATILDGIYASNLEAVWDSLLPAPDVRVIKKDGTIEKVDQTTAMVAAHYFLNVGKFFISLALLPATFTASVLSSPLRGRVDLLKGHAQREDRTPPEAYGFANSGFQDGALGTKKDPSSLRGRGIGNWDKVLDRDVQRVSSDGKKIGPITNGITLEEGHELNALFVNTIDHPEELAKLLAAQGCTAYRISLERSVLEPSVGVFNDFAIQKYQTLFRALQAKGIEPWVTLHHFTDPQWFEDKGGFEKEENIAGFVTFSETMVDAFPMVTNWMTFNEPGIRALEGYVRGEHPPEKKEIGAAAQVMRNLMIAHTQAFAAMKRKNRELNIGITHQWLKFMSFSSWNPIEKITAFFFTNLIHTPLFRFYKEGVLQVKMPFMANVQLRYESKQAPLFANFIGVQAYGFPRIKVGLNGGVAHPGAADKVQNFILSRFFNLGFTTGSTCSQGESMQYFGPPAKPQDLIPVLNEAFSIPESRVEEVGITETGADARRMKFGETEMKIDNDAQARDYREIAQIISKYPLKCLFYWTLNRHLEWRSGGLPQLGVTKVRNGADGALECEETAGLVAVRDIFAAFLARFNRAAA